MALNDEQLAQLIAVVKQMERQTVALTAAVETLTEQHDEVEAAIAASGFDNIRAICNNVRIMTVVLLGDETLGVEPLRPMVESLSTNWQRSKWIASGLVTSNIGALAAWVSTLLK